MSEYETHSHLCHIHPRLCDGLGAAGCDKRLREGLRRESRARRDNKGDILLDDS